MKGAGHNFGIVTSAYIKIYPKRTSTWHYHNYVWTQDQLESIFKALNKFQGKGQIPALMGVNFGQFSIEPTISKNEVSWVAFYHIMENHSLKFASKTLYRPSLSGRLLTMVPLLMLRSSWLPSTQFRLFQAPRVTFLTLSCLLLNKQILTANLARQSLMSEAPVGYRPTM